MRVYPSSKAKILYLLIEALFIHKLDEIKVYKNIHYLQFIFYIMNYISFSNDANTDNTT